MNRALAGFVAGLALVGTLAAGALVWPALSGYVFDKVGDAPIPEPQYDRSLLKAELVSAGFALGDEAHVRIFKREHLLELWMRTGDGRFTLFKSYSICKYSGGLGPKLVEGDRQAPEGFYRVAKAQLNPHSRHHLAFNIGFPNAFDQSLGRTGSFLMVHGGCTSVGCYAMTDAQIDEIYAVIESALGRGQREIDVAIYPFRMTKTALQAEAWSQWSPFWQNLKQGFDLFEAEGAPPKVSVCSGNYVFGGEALGAGCKPITGWV
ncbi:MAG: murein L,D-transpeptidase family protein [Devosia sp.]